MNNSIGNVLVFASFLTPSVINEFHELKNHIKNITLVGIMPPKTLLRELLFNFKTILFRIKYVILFMSIIISNLGKYPLSGLIYWYLHLVYLLILDQRIHFKIIHAHWIYPAGIVATTYCKYFPKKVVITVRGYDMDERTFDNLKLKKMVIETGFKADCIITGERRLYNNLNTCGFKKIIFTPPFVELPETDGVDLRKEKNIDPNSYIIVFGPHLRQTYGVMDFAKAMIKVSSDIANLLVICIGVGNETEQVSKLFDKNNINYKLTGKIPNSEVIKYLKLSDIVCNLSHWGQGMFTLEAFSCGKPVIGWNDADEIKIKDGITGLLTKSGNVEGLSEIIVKLYRNPDLRRKLGDKAKEIVETEYSKNNRIANVLSAYY